MKANNPRDHIASARRLTCAVRLLALLLLTCVLASCGSAEVAVLPTIAVLPSVTPAPTDTFTPSPTSTPSATETPDAIATSRSEIQATNAMAEQTLFAMQTSIAPTLTPTPSIIPSLTITMTRTPLPSPLPTRTESPISFNEAEYVQLITDGFRQGTSLISIQVADGRGVGGERVIIVAYASAASSVQLVYLEWMLLFFDIGKALTSNGLDVDAASLIMGDELGNTAGIIVASATDILAYYRDEITPEVFLDRLQVTSLSGDDLGVSPPRISTSGGCPDLSYTCTQLSSCEQARACLASGNSSLDADGDGIPCESICGG